MNKYLLVHPDDGIFIGTRLGSVFWSKAETGGQNTAFVFNDKGHAERMLSDWNPTRDIDEFELIEIETDGYYVTVNEIVAAGLDGW